jgi:transcriptional regulator with XRE-family HTH domain
MARTWSPRQFGALLNAAMATAGLSQGALAAQANVAESAISRWRSGERRPTPDSLRKVCRALGACGVDRATLVALFDAACHVAPADPAAPPEVPSWFSYHFPGEEWDESYAGVWASGLSEDDAILMLGLYLERHGLRRASLGGRLLAGTH